MEVSMSTRSRYQTEQRRQVTEYLAAHSDKYQTVDEIYNALKNAGSSIGRTTVYRTLEHLSDEGSVAKVIGTRGGSAYYKTLDGHEENQGQLLCLECGRAFSLDCSMLESFSQHVHEHHGFVVDEQHTVLCGTCKDCQKKESS